ncbi:MAG: PQQ-dependent sugar dehydrogenase [Alphaproteobacteria bacterium]
MISYRSLVAVIAIVFATSAATAQTFVDSEHYRLKLTPVTDRLEYPWGMAFLPDGNLLITERGGSLRVVQMNGDVSGEISGVPVVAAAGQGGLLDVALDPDFTEKKYIYLSFSEPGPGGAGTSVARGHLNLEAMQLTDVEVIFRQTPKTGTSRHFGSRLIFARDGTLFITTGDRGERDRVQDFSINRGQIIRINPDGTIPPDNPFVGKEGYRPEVWSLGHRNPQGAALHPETGDLWTVEHGARGGDEINIPRAGRNYGWPVISYGTHYSGGSIGIGTSAPGYEQPVYYWDPSIAPSGMTFYSGNVFPAWTGSVFVGALKDRLLSRLELDGDTVVAEEQFMHELGERIRAIQEGPDGFIYLLTDDDPGQLIRVEPAQ